MAKNAIVKAWNPYLQQDGRYASFPGPLEYSTSFPATENPISEGGIWQNGGTGGTMPFKNVQTVSGFAMASGYNSTYDDSSAILDPSFIDFGPDQWAEVTVYKDPSYTPINSHEVIIALRGTVNVSGPFYYPHYHFLTTVGGGFQLFWLNGTFGDFTEISVTSHNGGVGANVTGTVLRAEVQGTALRYYQDGVLKASATNSSISTGQPGCMFFVRPDTGQDLSKFCISDFSCGSL